MISAEFSQEDFDGWVIQKKKGILLVKYVDIMWDIENNKRITITRWQVYKTQQLDAASNSTQSMEMI